MTECGYCSDCKWWGSYQRPYYYPSERRRADGKGCGRALMYPDPDADDKTLALAVDGEDYLAELWTTPDFGCVQFEPKESGA